MKKNILLASALVLGMTFASCTKDDNNESTTTGSIEGKWNFSKMSITTSGVTSPEEDFIDNEPGCSKDYVEFLASGVYHAGDYDGSSCDFEETTGTWVKSGNMVTISVVGDADEILEVTSVTSTELKGKEALSDTQTVNLTLTKA